MVITEIRLIIFFAAKDGETLCNQQKQDQELTVAQIISSLLPNSIGCLYHCNTHDTICTSFPKLALGGRRVLMRDCVVKQQYKIHTEPHPFFCLLFLQIESSCFLMWTCFINSWGFESM